MTRASLVWRGSQPQARVSEVRKGNMAQVTRGGDERVRPGEGGKRGERGERERAGAAGRQSSAMHVGSISTNAWPEAGVGDRSA